MRDIQPPPEPNLRDAMDREIERAQAGPRRRRPGNPVREFLRAHTALTVFLILALGIGGYMLADRLVVTDEEQIREAIEAVADGMEDEDQERVLDQFSREFQEEGGMDYDFLESRLPALLHHANWGVSKPQLDGIEITGDTASVGQVYVVVGAEGRTVTSRWRVRLQREQGPDGEDRWRIVGAYPTSVQGRTVGGIRDLINRYGRYRR